MAVRVSNDSGTAFQVLKRATTFRSTARAARIAPSVHRWLFNLSLNTCDDGYLNSLSAWWPGGSGRTERVALDSIWSSRSNVASVETPCNYLSIHHLLQIITIYTFQCTSFPVERKFYLVIYSPDNDVVVLINLHCSSAILYLVSSFFLSR